MTTSAGLPRADPDQLESQRAELASAGVRAVVGTVVDLGGVSRAKVVPLTEFAAFHESGVGASPAWHVFCIDNAIAFTPELNVIGDQRLRIDPGALRQLDAGLAWAPAEFHEQDGTSSPLCSRGLLRRAEAALATRGLTARAGIELEFVLTQDNGTALPALGWGGYGLSAVLDREQFVLDVVAACAVAGLPLAQLHAEYGDQQFEVSFAPTGLVSAADDVVLARLVIGRVARRHGMAASFSPAPFAGGSGNGAHVHVSLSEGSAPVFSGGSGPHGMSGAGACALAGIVRGLPDVLGVLAGSVLSGQRLLPGHWSGAYSCWGLENREAAVRLCMAGAGSSSGANVEVKCVDPSANPYLALAVIVGLAAHGLAEEMPLVAEVSGDPASHPGGAPAVLETEQAAVLKALADSELACRILGEPIHTALLAVRRHEVAEHGRRSAEDLAERFRFAWSA